ncbi:MAG: hypothetical protein QW756_03395 [Nitrososphaerota archaeon]
MTWAKILGAALIALSASSSTFYILWFLGLIPWADPELAIRIPVLLITLAILLIIGIIGYIILATQPPKPISSKTTQ